jgi:hypothetical protein
MSLPKIQYPIFDLTLPSTKEKITFRPFTVKEEKLLLIAQEGGNRIEQIRAIRQIINNCCFDLPKDVGLLPSFDLEYCFIKIRAKSIGNIVELKYKDLTDSKIYTFEVDLDQIEIKFNPEHSNTVTISEDLGLVMKYPTIEVIESIKDDLKSTESSFMLIKKCIDTIYDAENTYNASEYSDKDLTEFVESIPAKAFEGITEFFDNLPVLVHELNYKDTEGTEKTITLQGIDDFFQ